MWFRFDCCTCLIYQRELAITLGKFNSMFTGLEQSAWFNRHTIGMMRRSALYFSYGSAVSIVFSIALSQLLLALALLALIISRKPLRFPPIKLPLALFFAYTLLAVGLSGHALAGWPQIRKFFVFGTLLVVASTFETARHAKLLCLSWLAVASLSAVLGFEQLIQRYRQAHSQGWGDYGFFLDSRLTGFASQWMTFGGELMIVFLMALSFVLFFPETKWRFWCVLSLPLLWTALMFGLTRSIFLVGLPLGMLYLLWQRKRWIAVLVPIFVVLIALAAPFQVYERMTSVIKAHGFVDSNARRIIMARTGVEMIRAHPWFGLGPEQVGPQFMQYVPNDVARPLPKGWYGHLHNMYLQYAAERGIPGLLLICWVLGRILRDLHRAARVYRDSTSVWVLYAAIAVTISILAEGLFEYNLGDSEILTMFLAVIASAYAVKWDLDARNKSLESLPRVRDTNENAISTVLELTA